MAKIELLHALVARAKTPAPRDHHQDASPRAHANWHLLHYFGPHAAGPKFADLADAATGWTHHDRSAALACDSGEMVLRLNFSEPFKGIVYPDHNRLSPCRFFGDGHLNYELRLPLRGCGTRQAAPRIFVNDVIVRFHKSLELEEDEVKTLICRYPPPLAANGLAEHSAGGELLANANNRSSLPPIQFPPPPYASPPSVNNPPTSGQNFELLDPTSATRPTLKGRIPNSSPGNVETFSENLIVAPTPIVDPSNKLLLLPPAQTDDPYAAPVPPSAGHNGKLSNNAPTGHRNADLFRHRDSPTDYLLINESSLANNSRNFVERLTSVELLFLISSLMFLVLLAAGLAGSYLCFRRQGRRGRSAAGGVAGGQVGAILRKRRRPMPTATAALRRYQQAPHLHYAGVGARQPAHLPPPQLNPPSSSPGSDVSGLGLLAESRAGRGGTGPHYARYMEPEMANMHAALGTAGRSVGHRVAPARPNQHRLLPPPVGRKPQVGVSPQPVVGRRDVGGGYGNGGRGRHAGELLMPARVDADTSSHQQPLDKYAFQWPPMMDTSGMNQTKYLQQHQRNVQRARNSLWRTKSLVSMAPDEQARLDHGVQSTPFCGTLSRQQQHRLAQSQAEQLSRRQQQHRYFAGFGRLGKKLGEDHASSDSETERASRPTADAATADPAAKRQNYRPKLLLKSIEDSYVTNLTEIYEQEYQMRDNRRPLSLGEWRSMRAELANKQNRKSPASPVSSPSSQPSATGGNLTANTSNSRAQSPSSDTSNTIERQYLSTQTKLRSLTELDVDFAKSIPFMAPRAQGHAEVVDADSPTIVAVGGKSAAGKPAATSDRVGGSSGSPDLVVSPEYDCVPAEATTSAGQQQVAPTSEPNSGASKQILKLENPDSPTKSAHNSVSYV